MRTFLEDWAADPLEDGEEAVQRLRVALDEYTSPLIRKTEPPPGMVTVEKGVGGL